MKRVRTANELERKYKLNGIYQNTLKNTKNIEYATKDVTELQQSLKDTRDAILINLGDIVQDAISLWFYSGVPTTSNVPYINWQTPSDHIGDLYYDQATGYVYKWNGSWQQQDDRNLIQAMALSNVGVDTLDHERQVFFTTPTNYECGDWWIQEDGTLLICQTTRATYNQDDWINSNEYSNAISTATLEDGVETQTTLRGTVITKTANWVKFEDLADGSSTTIYGGKISTNAITSNNYVQGTSGMKINLTNGAIDSKNFKTDSSGNMTCASATLTDGILKIGTKEIFNSSGVLSTMIVNGVVNTPRLIFAGDFCPMGEFWDGTNVYTKEHIAFSFTIPSNFTVVSAYVVLQHEPLVSKDDTTTTGRCRNLALYKGTLASGSKKYVDWNAGYIGNSNTTYTQIINAWGSSSTFTGSTSSMSSATSIDLKSQLVTGANHFVIMSTNGATSVNASNYGAVLGQMYITGYTKLS